MIDRRSSRLVRAMASLLIVAFAGAARAEDLRRELDALRQAIAPTAKRRCSTTSSRAARPWPRSPVPHGPRCRPQREPLRRELKRSLGVGRLPWPPTLRPRVVGTLRRDGYRIEKVIYDSLPGSPVPADLYVPEGLAGPAPAVLFYPGHWWPRQQGPAGLPGVRHQHRAARFVVLSFDPFSQGERGVSSRGHRRTEAILGRSGPARVRRVRTAGAGVLLPPQIDPRAGRDQRGLGRRLRRLDHRGIDDRIAAAVPVVGTSELAEQIRVSRPLDWYHAAEHYHFVPGLIRYADDRRLVAMTSRKPVLIIAASPTKSFPVAGVEEVTDYGPGTLLGLQRRGEARADDGWGGEGRLTAMEREAACRSSPR